MKLSIEARAGFIGIVALLALIWGINYLKGKNLLRSTYTLEAFYNNAGGLESAAPVTMNGVRIGYVEEIHLRTGETPPVRVLIHIEKAYELSSHSRAVLHSADLLGMKAIRIDPGGSGPALKHRDTISTRMEEAVLSRLQAGVEPVLARVGSAATTLDTLAGSLAAIADSPRLRSTLKYLASVSGSLNRLLEPEGPLDRTANDLSAFSAMLVDQKDELAETISHLNSIARSLDSAGTGELVTGIGRASTQLADLLEQLNSGTGTAGKLLHSDTLHNALALLVADLDSLIRDLEENPQDYVHVSVFGGSRRKN